MGLEAILSAFINMAPSDAPIEPKTLEALDLAITAHTEQSSASNGQTYEYKKDLLEIKIFKENIKSKINPSLHSSMNVSVTYDKKCIPPTRFENIATSAGWEKDQPIGPHGVLIPGNFFRKNDGFIIVNYDASGRCLAGFSMSQDRPLAPAK